MRVTKKQQQTIVQAHARNFETLRSAFLSGDVALMECKVNATGEKVAVICAVGGGREESGACEFTFTPFAMFFNGNPYELLSPPNPNGGFHEEENHGTNTQSRV